MPDIAIISARASHIKPIGLAMSEWDAIECRAFGHCPRTALRESLAASSFAATAMIDGLPAMMFGVVPLSHWEGRIWALGTPLARQFKRRLLEVGDMAIADMLRTYGRLSNYVAQGNRNARRALRYWGAIEGDPVEIAGRDFLPFAIGRA